MLTDAAPWCIIVTWSVTIMRIDEMRDREQKLYDIASSQQGYFTSKQASASGYSRRLQNYHVSTGNWKRIDFGIYRLIKYPVSEHEEFVRWSLWSRNLLDIPQAVVSHDSALSFYEIGDTIPTKMHLTVPPAFRKKSARRCALYKKTLPPESVKKYDGFSITTPLQTIIDSAEGNLSMEQLERSIRDAFRKGILVPVSITEAKMSAKAKEKVLIIIDRYKRNPNI